MKECTEYEGQPQSVHSSLNLGGKSNNVYQAMARLTTYHYGRSMYATGSSFDFDMTCGAVLHTALSAADHQSAQMGGSVEKISPLCFEARAGIPICIIIQKLHTGTRRNCPHMHQDERNVRPTYKAVLSFNRMVCN